MSALGLRPWQNDNKVAFIRLEGTMFGGVPMHMEVRLSVEDSPTPPGVAIDMIRCAKSPRPGPRGPIEAPAAFFCKHPPRQMTDDVAYAEVETFIHGK
jgi:myo-inositol-1-phosphate synthase